MIETLTSIWTDYTLRTVTLGAATLGAVSGILGCFAVLRRRSLLGDAISHAALPGIVLAWLLTGSKSTPILILGAAVAGWAAAAIVSALAGRERIRTDTVLALVLSVFFGAGLVLLTVAQRRPDASQAGLEGFLFGQAAALVVSDITTFVVIGLVSVTVVLALWKEFKILCFDLDAAAVLGLPVRALDQVLTILLVVAVVSGLQTVGVVLMSALLVAPAVAARQWTDELGAMVLLAATFGALAGASGAIVSGLIARVPTGPAVVLAAGVIVLISLLCAPRRGVLWRLRRTPTIPRREGAGDAAAS